MRVTLATLLKESVAQLGTQINGKFDMSTYTQFVDTYPAQIVTLAEQVWHFSLMGNLCMLFYDDPFCL